MKATTVASLNPTIGKIKREQEHFDRKHEEEKEMAKIF
jgi:hypothetical protein